MGQGDFSGLGELMIPSFFLSFSSLRTRSPFTPPSLPDAQTRGRLPFRKISPSLPWKCYTSRACSKIFFSFVQFKVPLDYFSHLFLLRCRELKRRVALF